MSIKHLCERQMIKDRKMPKSKYASDVNSSAAREILRTSKDDVWDSRRDVCANGYSIGAFAGLAL
jgi:hypothetical protein